MSKLRVASFTVSIDSFGAGPDQDINNPIGVGGNSLIGWANPRRTRPDAHAQHRRIIMNLITVFFAFVLLTSASHAQERVLLAAEDDWYPYSAKRDNEAKGRSVEIVKAAYTAVGVELTLDLVPFNRGMILTRAGRYAGVFNAGLNAEVRREFLIPKNPVAESEQVAVARIGVPFKDRRSFHGKRLVLTHGYTYPTEIITDPNNQIQRALGDINNMKMLAAGRADFTIVDRLVALSIFAKEPALKQKLQIVGKLHSENIYVLFSKNEGGQRALDLFDKGMEKILRNGDLKMIISRWEAKLR